MKKIICLIACLLISVSASAKIWIPIIRVPDASKPMVLQDLDIDLRVEGNLARTTYTMTFFNPNERVLSGEMIFPLMPRQAVVGMALDIRGKMQDASVVEKKRARKIYDQQVNRGIDPALVEKVSGNQYRMNIYPLNPKGTRQIRIVTEEVLSAHDGQITLSLPLGLEQTLKHFVLKLAVEQASAGKPELKTDFRNLAFTTQQGWLEASVEKTDFWLDNSLTLTFPTKTQPFVYTGAQDGQDYFYARVPMKAERKAAPAPKKIAVLWDTSASGNQRNTTLETAWLSAYLRAIKQTTVELIPFHITRQKAQFFVIKGGDSKALTDRIKTLAYDGATRLDNLNPGEIKADIILLFTDGIATISESDLGTIKVPVYVITTATATQGPMLADLAQRTRGEVLDLNQIKIPEAVARLTHTPLRLVSVSGQARDIYPRIGAVVDSDLIVVGKYDGKPQDLTLNFGYAAGKATQSKTIHIGINQNNPIAPRQWAIRRVQDLELDKKKNRDEIVKLGKAFELLTEETSLLVLDTLEDYLKYDVVPKDPEMRANYERWKKPEGHIIIMGDTKVAKHYRQTQKDLPPVRTTEYRRLVDNIRAMIPLKRWFDKDEKAPDPMVPDEPNDFEIDPKEVGEEKRDWVYDKGSVSGRVIESDGMAINARMMAKGANSEAQEAQVEVRLREWSPNTPYMKQLRPVADKDLYQAYLKQREAYADMPAFYLDVAEELAKRGQTNSAVRVLSNLLEMMPDNKTLIRIVAQKLMTWQQNELAEILFKSIVREWPELAEGTYDLAAYYDSVGQNQQALDLYLKLLNNDWEDNVRRQTILIAMNGLIARDKTLNTRAIHPDLIFALPMDLRITLGKTSNAGWVGLDIVDPFKNWGNPRVWGENNDYRLKHAREGLYQIRTDRGWARWERGGLLPPVVWLDIYTHFGQKNQTHDRVVVRLDEVQNRKLASVVFTNGNCENNPANPIRYLGACTNCADARGLFLPKLICDQCENRVMVGDFCMPKCTEAAPMQSRIGKCYACDNAKALKLSAEECAKCPNREMVCGYCAIKGSVKNEACRSKEITMDCDNKQPVSASAEDCAKCPNREMVGKYCSLKQCPAKAPLQSDNGRCEDCNTAGSIIVSAEDCAKCPNRKMQGKYCVRQACGENEPLLLEDTDMCMACEFAGPIKTDAKTCAKCPNRHMVGEQCRPICADKTLLEDAYGKCLSCNENDEVEATAEACAKCPNRRMEDGRCVKISCQSEAEIESKDGSCFACDATYGITTYPEECAKCPNRKMLNGECVPVCAEAGMLQAESGRCYACDTKEHVWTDEENCAKCPNRHYKDGRCVAACPADKPILDRWGDCHSCDEEEDFETDEQTCAKCPARKQFGEMCRRPCDKYTPMQETQWGRCYDCYADNDENFTAEDCAKCPNRRMVNGRCMDYGPEMYRQFLSE